MPSTSNDKLVDALRELGCSQQEIALYVTSLSLGPVPVSTLATTLSIARPNAYKVIASLEKRGLARFSVRTGHRTMFAVASPSAISKLLEAKRKDLDAVREHFIATLPNLLALHRQGDRPSGVTILSTRDEWMDVFFQILDEEEHTTDFFGNIDEWIRFVTWQDEWRWIRERVKRKIRIRLLLLPSAEGDSYLEREEQSYREYRMLRGATTFSPSYQLFANKVIIWQPATPLAILIEDALIVGMLKSIFELLWENASVPARKIGGDRRGAKRSSGKSSP